MCLIHLCQDTNILESRILMHPDFESRQSCWMLNEWHIFKHRQHLCFPSGWPVNRNTQQIFVRADGMFSSAGSDISCLLNGLEQLSFAFHELGIINVALAIMQISTAAALWPASTIYIGVGPLLLGVGQSGRRHWGGPPSCWGGPVFVGVGQ